MTIRSAVIEVRRTDWQRWFFVGRPYGAKAPEIATCHPSLTPLSSTIITLDVRQGYIITKSLATLSVPGRSMSFFSSPKCPDCFWGPSKISRD